MIARGRAVRLSCEGSVTEQMILGHLVSLGYETVCDLTENRQISSACLLSEDLFDAPQPHVLAIASFEVWGERLLSCPTPVLCLASGSADGFSGDVPVAHSGSFCAIASRDFGGLDEKSLLNDVLAYLLFMRDIAAEFSRAVSAHRSYQKLVDAAEDFFGCFIGITDANGMLLAHTRNIPPRDEINLALVDKGYLPLDLLSCQPFAGCLPESAEQQMGIAVHPAQDSFPYQLVTAAIHVQGRFAAHVVVAKDDEVTPAFMDAFRFFARYCEKLVGDTCGAVSAMGGTFDQAFLLKLVAERDLSVAFVREQAELLSIPLTGRFALLRIDCDAGMEDRTGVVAEAVRHGLDVSCVPFALDGSLGVLLFEEALGTKNGGFADACEQCSRIARLPVYVSDAFNRLSSVYYAWRQVCAVRKYAANIRLCRELSGSPLNPSIMRFRDAFCFWWFDDEADEEIRDFSLTHLLVNDIASVSEVKRTDDLKLLCLYLLYERKATIVGSKCHMHRNGVVYRIEKLEKMYGIDLGDYLTRQYIMTSILAKASRSQEFSRLLSR